MIRIPSLNDRREELSFILDTILQMTAFNPGGTIRIQEVGSNALKKLMGFDYTKGNFRDLENMLRNACRRAMSDGRKYIVSERKPYKSPPFSKGGPGGGFYQPVEIPLYERGIYEEIWCFSFKHYIVKKDVTSSFLNTTHNPERTQKLILYVNSYSRCDNHITPS